jgi:uncharacterized protein YegL
MASSVPLIVAEEPVSRSGARPEPARRPHVVVAYATRDGDVHLLDDGRPLRWRDQMFSEYHTRYEVDMSDHQRTVQLGSSPPPSVGGVYRFQVTLDIGFRVHDAAAVVRRNVRDALPLVHAHLLDACHRVVARYRVGEADAAQRALAQHFAEPQVIEDCLLLYKCRARVAPDPNWVQHLRAREEAEQANRDRAVRHQLNADDAHRGVAIEAIKQDGRIRARARERDTLAGRPIDVRELVAMAIEQDPSNIKYAIEKLSEVEAAQDQRVGQRISEFADKNLVGKADVAAYIGHSMGQLSGGAIPAAGWDDPLPLGGAPRALIPVYVVIDGSAALDGYAGHLDAGVQALLDALADEPEIADAVRLSVLQYADHVAIPLAMGTVRAGLRLPPLTPYGPARYGVAFRRLLDCVPRDAEALKAQSSRVWRPQVVFFSGDRPADAPAWTEPHRALVDRQAHRAAPDIVACGVGRADPAAIAGVATRPELAFMSADADTAAAIERFCAFVRQHVLGYGRALLDGDLGPLVCAPEGFRLAKELI